MIVMMGSRSVWQADIPVSTYSKVASRGFTHLSCRPPPTTSLRRQLSTVRVCQASLLRGTVLTRFSAFSETLAAEVGQFGIRVLLVITGGFRTTQEKQIYKAETHISDYDGFRERIIETIDNAFVRSRNDPAKAMEIVADVVRSEGKAEGAELPQMLLLGPATFTQARAYTGKLTASVQQWEAIGTDMEFDTHKPR